MEGKALIILLFERCGRITLQASCYILAGVSVFGLSFFVNAEQEVNNKMDHLHLQVFDCG